MPSIGNPNIGTNSFEKISIRKETDGKKNLGEQLNEISGRGLESQFVDRKTHNKLAKDGFLKLLSFQLSNQDPLSPMDQKRFAADLAQFSQLEQLANINTNMKKSGENIPAQNKFYGASFIGKKILTDGATVSYKQGERPELPFYLDKKAEKAIVRIYDESNNIIRRLNLENLPKGNQSIQWDGRGEDNRFAVQGIYRFDVLAFDAQYAKFNGKSQVEGIVTGVNFENGETILTVNNGSKVALRDVRQFKIPEDSHRENVEKIVRKNMKKIYNNSVNNYN